MRKRTTAVIARPESSGSRMTSLVIKSCWFITRVPSSVRDANMMEKGRENCTDKFRSHNLTAVVQVRSQPRDKRTAPRAIPKGKKLGGARRVKEDHRKRGIP